MKPSAADTAADTTVANVATATGAPANNAVAAIVVVTAAAPLPHSHQQRQLPAKLLKQLSSLSHPKHPSLFLYHDTGIKLFIKLAPVSVSNYDSNFTGPFLPI